MTIKAKLISSELGKEQIEFEGEIGHLNARGQIDYLQNRINENQKIINDTQERIDAINAILPDPENPKKSLFSKFIGLFK